MTDYNERRRRLALCVKSDLNGNLAPDLDQRIRG
jgi:hypothetical protein